MSAPKKKLLEEDEKVEFSINKKFATSYLRSKKEEQISKLKDKYGELLNSESESESEPEDENAELIDEKVAEDFMSLLPKLANKDESLKNPNVQYFKEEPQKIIEKEKKQKPYTYKDMVREEVLQNLNKPHFTEDDVSHTTKPIDFEEQPIAQKEILAKKEFLKAAALEDDDDTILKKRVKSTEEREKEENEYLKFVQSLRKKKDPSAEVLLNYWTNDNVDEDEKFLRSYIINKGWVDKDNEAIPTYDDIVNDDEYEEDEKDIKQQEQYEEAFNFRYEEPGATVIPSFPRNPEESARKPDERRKLKRQRRKEKKEKELKQKEDEKKHLMRLKKEQIIDRLKIISEITGSTDEKLKGIDLDGEWDPDAYDKEMSSVFNDDYYNEKENEDEKPVFSDEEEAPLPQIPGHNVGKEENQGEGQGEENQEHGDKEVDPKVLEEKKKELDKYLEEYYKLDYEDIVGGIPCRFKYTKVKPLNYGLDSAEILVADDTELRKIIPLKRLNPYREDQGELPPKRRNFRPNNTQWNKNNRNNKDNKSNNNKNWNRNNKK